MKNSYLLWRDVTQDTDGEARTREGMAGDEMLRHTELTTHTTHLVFEQPLQRLAELQAHLLRQATNVVVTLNDLTRDVQRLDTIGIDCTLRQPLGIGDLLRLGIEHLNEIAADDLTLLLRIGDTSQVSEELLAGIDSDHVETQHLIVVHHLTELVLTEHTVIDEDTGEAVADSSVQQHGSDGGVDTSAQT